jgi:hypothetical protein
MAEWTLAKLRTKIKSITGRPGQSDVEVDDFINDYYQYQLPTDVNAEELDTWFKMETIYGQGGYGIDSDMKSMKKPITCDGIEIVLHRDAEYFFKLYPRSDESVDTYGTPEMMLIYNKTVYLRPIPDDAYMIQASVSSRPDALELSTDEIEDSQWGNLIVYGVAINMHLNNGEFDEAKEKTDMFNYYKNSVARKNLSKYSAVRSVPRF